MTCLPLQMVCFTIADDTFTIADGVFYHCRCCALPVSNDVTVACFTNARWYVLLMPDGVADPWFPLFSFYCCWILLLFVLIFEHILPITDGTFYKCQIVCFTITGGVLLPVPDGVFYHCRCGSGMFYQCQMVCFTSARWCVLPMPDGVFYQCQITFPFTYKWLFLWADPLFPLTFLVNSWIPGMLDGLFQASFLSALLLFWLCVYHGVRQVHCAGPVRWHSLVG